MTDLEAAVIDAARAWRSALIPSTSTSRWPQVRDLAAAVDRLDCPHPREERVFHLSGERGCARCGAALTAEDSTPDPEQST